MAEKLPFELINHILSYRPSHPTAKAITCCKFCGNKRKPTVWIYDNWELENMFNPHFINRRGVKEFCGFSCQYAIKKTKKNYDIRIPWIPEPWDYEDYDGIYNLY